MKIFLSQSKLRIPKLLFVCFCLTSGKLAWSEPFYVPEPELEKAICETLGITREELSGELIARDLRSLVVVGRQIRSLQGLEVAENLDTLVLKNNLISDLSPLSDLPSLRILDLSGNRISSLRDLASLSRSRMEKRIMEIKSALEDHKFPKDQKAEIILELSENLQRLKRGPWSLQKINLANNRLLGLSGIGELTSLVHLDVSANALIDLEGVGNLKSLHTLYAQRNQLGRVEGFEDTNRNKQFDEGEPIEDKSGNGKRDVDPLVELDSLPRLTNLHLYDNQIATTALIKGLPSLRILLLSGNAIRKISGLEGSSNLTTLSLSNNKIGSLAGIDAFSNLQSLHLVENWICDLRPLSTLSNIRELSLQRNQLMDVTPLRSLTALEILHLSNNLIYDPKPLWGLDKLRRLSLGGNCIDLENYKIQTSMGEMKSKGVLVRASEQRRRIIPAERLISVLSGNPSSNISLGDYLLTNGYFRLIDLIEDSTVTEEDKEVAFNSWESRLKIGKSLEDLSFPGR